MSSSLQTVKRQASSSLVSVTVRAQKSFAAYSLSLPTIRSLEDLSSLNVFSEHLCKRSRWLQTLIGEILVLSTETWYQCLNVIITSSLCNFISAFQNIMGVPYKGTINAIVWSALNVRTTVNHIEFMDEGYLRSEASLWWARTRGSIIWGNSKKWHRLPQSLIRDKREPDYYMWSPVDINTVTNSSLRKLFDNRE